MKHTPGPWHLDPPGYCEYIWGPNQEMIANMRGVGAQLPIEANARLIGAAPELLNACKIIETWLACLEVATPDDPLLTALREKYHRPYRQVLQAAIAKAEK